MWKRSHFMLWPVVFTWPALTNEWSRLARFNFSLSVSNHNFVMQTTQMNHTRIDWLTAWLELLALACLIYRFLYYTDHDILTTGPFFVSFHSDISPCQSSPCIRGGTCNVESNGYSCDCPPFNSGRHYEGKYKKPQTLYIGWTEHGQIQWPMKR